MGKLSCFVIVAGLALCAGCHSPAVYPLQPGETITFRDAGRANAFRQASGNDAYSQGASVRVTRPTLVECE
jgi:hypothetical protein